MTLRERALNLLARREHSRAELARKLAVHGEADEIDALLDALERENLLSNERYAESLAHARAGRHGSLRLKADLRAHGVPDAVAAEAVRAARDADLEGARAVWLKKFGQAPIDAAERARQLRFLAGRGFPLDIAQRVVGGRDEE
ncbi:MAG: recombination regulator RecX [Pseudomonadota bacterium]